MYVSILKRIVHLMFNKINPVMKNLFILSLVVLMSCVSTYGQKVYGNKKKIHNGYYLTKVDGKIGLTDSIGNIIIPNEYESLDFSRGSSGLSVKNGKVGLIDLSGRVIIPNEYESIDFNGSSFGQSVKDGKVGIIDQTGTVIIPNEYESISFNGSIGKSIKDGKMGLINLQGKVLIPNLYESIDYKLNRDSVFVVKDGVNEVILMDW